MKRSCPEKTEGEKELKLNTREGMIAQAQHLLGLQRAMDHSNKKLYAEINASIASLRRRLGKNFPKLVHPDNESFVEFDL